MSEDPNVDMMQAIDEGLAAGAFIPYFQPIVKLPNRDLLGLEALARWRRDGEVLPPAAFAAGLQDLEMEARISAAITQQAIDAAMTLKQRGLSFGSMAVNFAERQLADVEYADDLLAQLVERGLDPSELSIEIRETVRFSEASREDFAGMSRLAAAGVVVAIDDFGSGYAEVQSILSPLIKRVKFDLSLTRAAVADERARKLLRHCLTLADELGLESVVEGVEDLAGEAMLIGLGCDAVQGYFYAKPAPLEQVIARLESGGYHDFEGDAAPSAKAQGG